MTREQIYHRRLARKYGLMACHADTYAHYVNGQDYRGEGSQFQFAKAAAWHVFKAHPELREPEWTCRAIGRFIRGCKCRACQPFLHDPALRNPELREIA